MHDVTGASTAFVVNGLVAQSTPPAARSTLFNKIAELFASFCEFLSKANQAIPQASSLTEKTIEKDGGEADLAVCCCELLFCCCLLQDNERRRSYDHHHYSHHHRHHHRCY